MVRKRYRQSTRHLILPALNQKQLAIASGLSCSAVSRLFSMKDGQKRGKYPRLETLQKLQTGLEQLTGHRYTIEQLARAMRTDLKLPLPDTATASEPSAQVA